MSFAFLLTFLGKPLVLVSRITNKRKANEIEIMKNIRGVLKGSNIALIAFSFTLIITEVLNCGMEFLERHRFDEYRTVRGIFHISWGFGLIIGLLGLATGYFGFNASKRYGRAYRENRNLNTMMVL